MVRPATPYLLARDYTVDTIPHQLALEFVGAHHYTRGAANTAVHRHGLFHRENPLDLLGIVLWIPPTPAAAQAVAADPGGVLACSRLVVEPGMPTNAASFLLARSIRLVRADDRWHTLVTYADTAQGHTGAIYLATGWTFDGIVRGHGRWYDARGRQVSAKAGRHRTHGEMRELGYRYEPGAPLRRYTMRIRPTWAEQQAARIRAEGAQIQPETVAAIADRFRRHIGGAYELIAAQIEHDHRRTP